MSSVTGPAKDGLAAVTPIVSRRAAAQIADQIVLAIREGNIGCGDRLPSERELGRRFSVSRPTMREALTALELAGVVEAQKGRGTVVLATPSQLVMWGTDVLPHEAFETRLVIEPELARLAAEKRYPEDIAALRAALAELESEFAATGTSRGDLAIHRGVARAARNRILERALEDALVHLQSERWIDLNYQIWQAPEARRELHDDAEQIIELIEQGSAGEAADLWRRHVVRSRDRALARAPQRTLADAAQSR